MVYAWDVLMDLSCIDYPSVSTNVPSTVNDPNCRPPTIQPLNGASDSPAVPPLLVTSSLPNPQNSPLSLVGVGEPRKTVLAS